jgi:tetratricopeptide (TPR) repeat protein
MSSPGAVGRWPVFVFAAIHAVVACAQQEPLAPLFEERFEKHVVSNNAYHLIPMRGSFQLNQLVNKSVELRSGTILVRPQLAGARVVWQLDLAFPRNKDDKPLAVDFGFVLANETILAARLERNADAGSEGGRLRFRKLLTTDRLEEGEALRDAIPLPKIPEGLWQFEYNQGMLSVRLPGGIQHSAYDRKQGGLAIFVAGVTWQQDEGATLCRTMQASSTRAPNMPSDSVRAEIRRGSEMNKEASELGRAGDSDRALATMREALELFRKLRGEDSRDYANAVTNLAFLLNGAKQFPEAIDTAKKAVWLYTTLLGSEHPQTALGSFGLGQIFLAAGYPAEAIPHLLEAARVIEGVNGSEDKMVRSIRDLTVKIEASESAGTGKVGNPSK